MSSDSKIAVVTGGASGIGLATVEHLHQVGWQVISLDLPERTEVPELKALGIECLGIDVNDEALMRDVEKKIVDKHGPIDALVNSAGVIQKREKPEDLSMQDWDFVVNTDFRGTYLSCVVFANSMLQAGSGSIVNIASVTSFRAVPLHAYAPAKAAVMSLTQTLAGEWGHRGIRVNGVAPGYTLTPALQAAIDRGDRDIKALTRQAALGRMVMPQEVAYSIAFLLSDQAQAITGVTLPVDCGWLASTGWETYGGLAHTHGQPPTTAGAR
jgi:NAD(P)-dependent dehydrogenase (short-subunit alcohol dehydrogenase family)